MEVCSLSHGVMLPLGATPIHPSTGWLSLSPSSLTRSPIGLPYDSLPLMGELRAYHVPFVYPRGLGLASPPVVLHLRQVS